MLFENIDLKTLEPYIVWSYFFSAWGMGGRFPDIFEHPQKGTQAKELYTDAQSLLNEITTQGLIQAKAVAAILPAASTGDDVLLYTDESHARILKILPQLRNQEMKIGEPNLCLADFLPDAGSSRKDYMGLFTLTAGFGLHDLITRFKQEHDDYSAIMAKALADRLAEACTTWLHHELYKSYARITGKDPGIFSGIRPAVGYPCCPDHSMKRDIFDLLDVGKTLGMELTESYMMIPESSVCGFIFFHPEARYFSVGKIDAEQLADYAVRRGMNVNELKRLMPNNVM